MRYGVFTFFTDEGISPVDLGTALEERGFGSLFATEHSHIPVYTQTPYPMGGPIPPQYYRTLDPFVSLTMIAIWTEEKADFHGDFVDFDPVYSWPKPVSKPYPPLYLGGGPAGFRRITELGAGWMGISPSAEALSGELEALRDMAGRDVPVIGSHIGQQTAKALEGYRELGIEQVAVELPTEPRDETLRRLDELYTEFSRLG